MFTETWLSDKVNSCELGFNNYHTYRYDRNNDTSHLSNGGGVLIAINENFTSQLLKLPHTKLEILFVLIKLNRTNLIVSAVYIPNCSSIEIFTEYFDCVNYVMYNYPDSNIVLLGDYNLPSANFSNKNSFFFDYLDNLNIVQFNNILNFNNVLLDYVISNCKSLFVNLNNFPIVNIDAHHPPLEINFTVESGVNYISNNEIKYNWDKADYESIIKSLGNVNWTELLNNNIMDTNIKLFYNIVYSLINQFVLHDFMENLFHHGLVII